MIYKAMTVDIHQKIAHIQLNRPDALNTMNLDFWREFPNVVEELDKGADARVLVLSSSGKHFCAGMDLSVFTSGLLDSEAELGRQRESLRRVVLELQASFNILEKIRIPVLAAVHGGCIGGAVDMVTACDSRYCTEDAFFSIEETKIGMTADLGTLQRLPHIIPEGLCRELAYTGRRMYAEEACRAGLVNQVYSDQESLISGVMEIAEQIAARSPLAVAGCKEMFNYGRDHSVTDGLQYMAAWQSGMFQPQNDMVEAFTAKAEKRPPVFEKLSNNKKTFQSGE